MDREVFLRALTFLEKQDPALSWPPAEAQVMLHEHVVSFEPTSIESSNESLIGPASFAPPLTDQSIKQNKKSFDPSVTHMEVAIVRRSSSTATTSSLKTAGSPAASSGSSTTLGGGSITSSQSPKTPNTDTVVRKDTLDERVDLYFYVGEQHVFRVDTKQLKHIQIIPGVTKHDPKKHLPPCLMLFFDICCLRIFSMATCLDKDATDAYELLEKAGTELQSLLNRRKDPSTMMIQTEGSTCTTPTESSATSSSFLEPGQRDSPFDSLANVESSSSDEQNQHHSDVMMNQLKRRHSSLQSSWDGINSLLKTPAEPIATLLNKGDSIHDALGPLMTAIAQDLSEARQVRNDTLGLQEQHQQHQAALDKLLESAFPPPLKQRRRGLTPPTRNIHSNNNGDLNDLRKQAVDLVQQQQQTIRARHCLWLLP